MARALVFLFPWFSAIHLAVVTAGDYGLYSLILNSKLLTCNLNKSLIEDVSLMKMYMYDFKNDYNESSYLNTSAAQILGNSTFEKTRTTLLWIPGFTDTIDGNNQEVARQNLKAFPDSYLYIVDHHNYTLRNNLDYLGAYKRAVEHYWSIGRAIALWLIEMVNGGVELQNIIVMGHSLGGQISAAVGEVFLNETGTKLPKIKGSDPAGPCFSKAPEEYQLRSGLADQVETYHCNAGTLGTKNNLADAMYYVNGGTKQPRCKNVKSVVEEIAIPIASNIASCSHNTCVEVLTLPATVSGIWVATPCNSKKNYHKGKCAGNTTTTAGIYSPSFNEGIYYFNTTGYKLN